MTSEHKSTSNLISNSVFIQLEAISIDARRSKVCLLCYRRLYEVYYSAALQLTARWVATVYRRIVRALIVCLCRPAYLITNSSRIGKQVAETRQVNSLIRHQSTNRASLDPNSTNSMTPPPVAAMTASAVCL